MTHRELIEYGVWCGLHGISAENAMKLRRMARGLKTMAERACDDMSWSMRDEKRQDRAEERLAKFLLDEIHMTAEISRDPRGCVVKLDYGDGFSQYGVPDWA